MQTQADAQRSKVWNSPKASVRGSLPTPKLGESAGLTKRSLIGARRKVVYRESWIYCLPKKWRRRKTGPRMPTCMRSDTSHSSKTKNEFDFGVAVNAKGVVDRLLNGLTSSPRAVRWIRTR